VGVERGREEEQERKKKKKRREQKKKERGEMWATWQSGVGC
jgi:hypothetical protein